MSTAVDELRILRLGKRFGSNPVLKSVDLTIRSGDFVGLMGPNGAGKSTLIKILDGIYDFDEGEIFIGGRSVRDLKGNPHIRVIHQDLGLIEDLTIWENLRLGRPALRRRIGLLDHEGERASARQAMERVGLALDIELEVRELSSAERTLVAVARALDEGANLLVLDEATSTLPTADAARLIAQMRDVAADGAAVLMVTHKLSEILDGPDRVVVLIDGEIVTDIERGSLDRQGLVALLRAHEASAVDVQPRAPQVGERLIALKQVEARGCGPVDLEIHRGEVLGLTGSPGSGMHDLALVVAGFNPVTRGTKGSVRGLTTALVPAAREVEGGFSDQSTRQNLTISAIRKWRSPMGLLAGSKERVESATLLEQLAVVPPDPEGPFSPLSGGNKQKVIFGRALMKDPDLYVLCEPTRGVDVTTRFQIYELIRRVQDAGRSGVLVVSADFEDLLAVCDRVTVVQEGKLGDFTPVGELTNEALEELL
jgi:ribose transport system ATP-binding protein